MLAIAGLEKILAVVAAASSLLLRVEVGQQAERALEHLRRDEAGGQALVDLQAGQQRLADGPGLDGCGPRGQLVSIGAGQLLQPALDSRAAAVPVARRSNRPAVAPATQADPYPLYAQVRQCGLVRSPLGVFAAADHATVASILRDRRFSSSPVHQPGYRPPSYPPGDPRAALPAEHMLTMGPPDHTRLRRLVAGAFTPRAIAGLEPWIREVTVRLLTAADGAAGFDLIDALAFPLPIAVICHLLGVPAEDQAQFRAWGHDVAATLDPQTAATAQAQTRAAELALTGYLQDLVRERRANPDDSILSALIAAEEEGDRADPAVPGA